MPRSTSPVYSERFDRAVALAVRDFRSVVRKQRGVPYITHLFTVTALVGEHGGDEDQLIAAMLHDWLEDIEGASVETLEAEFGPRVRSYVEALSDVIAVHPKPPWRERKLAFLDRIRNEPSFVKLICTADKLHNVQSLIQEIADRDISVLDGFNGGRDGTLWYYRTIVEALEDGWDHPLLVILRRQVVALHAACGIRIPTTPA